MLDYDDVGYSPTKMATVGMTGSGPNGGLGGLGGGRGDYPCPECGRMYKLKSSLRNHQKWECGKEPQFQCPFCAYKAKQKMHIGRHLERMHKDIVNMECKPAFLKELIAARVKKESSGKGSSRPTATSTPTSSASSNPIAVVAAAAASSPPSSSSRFVAAIGEDK